MLQTAFQPSCMNRAWVFEWHKRFKESRESVRDDEKCGRSKEVRTPEMIGQIKNFMDKDRRLSIVHSLMSVWELYTQLFAILKMRKICAKFFPDVLREDQKERRCHDSRETCNERWIYCYDPETKRQSSQWNHAGSPRPKKVRQSKSTHKTFDDPFFWQHWHELHALGSHWTDS